MEIFCIGFLLSEVSEGFFVGMLDKLKDFFLGTYSHTPFFSFNSIYFLHPFISLNILFCRLINHNFNYFNIIIFDHDPQTTRPRLQPHQS